MTETGLTDIRVLEFGDLVSAPYCAKLLGDLGAEVIKVEKPQIGDSARRLGPFAGDKPGLERSGLYAYLNTSKRGITLNTRSAAGKKIFLKLIAETDILVENNPPALMEELGLNYAALEKINPGLIMVSITPFGQTGPHRDYKADEMIIYQGTGYGITSTICYKEPVLPPITAAGRQTQFNAGQVGAVTALFALLARDKDGAGQHVDISNQEVIAGEYEAYVEYWTYMAMETGGYSTPKVQPVTSLQCKDGWVFIMCMEDHQFNNLVKVMGNPEWAQNELFKDRFTRAEYVDALIPLLTDWTLQRTKEEVFRLAQEAHVPLAPAYNAEEIINSPQLKARNFFVEIDHPVIGPARYPGAPYALSETPWRIQRRAPLLGEHNEEIYCGRLAYDREDLVRLTQMGVI